jgi:glycosyltransferase involved in cell wall biosynthesis
VRLSIVIPVLNAVDTIGAQLDALVAQLSSASAEIVVVDNGSTDDTLREVADYAAHVPALRVVHCAERGECVARNMGIREARADRLLLCDHDDVVADDWVARLDAALDHHALVGGALEVTKLNATWVSELYPGAPTRRDRMSRSIAGHPYLFSSNMGMHRSVFDAVGGFDPAFKGGADEVDFSIRAAAAGFDLYFVPGAVVHRRLRPTVPSMMRQHYQYAKGDARVYRKHIGTGLVDAPSRRSQVAMVKVYWRQVRSVGSLRDPVARCRLALRVSWIAGALAAAPRYRILV